jgi:hypothetical protein
MLDILSFYDKDSFKKIKKLDKEDIDLNLTKLDDNILCWNNEVYVPNDNDMYDLIKLRYFYSNVNFSKLDTDMIIIFNDKYGMLYSLLPKDVTICIVNDDDMLNDDDAIYIRELNGVDEQLLFSCNDIEKFSTKKTVILLDDNIIKLYDIQNAKYGLFISKVSNFVVYSFFDYALSMYSTLGENKKEVFRMKEIITDDEWCLIKTEVETI